MSNKFAHLKDKIRLLFVKDKEPFLKLYNILGFYPRNISIYRTAMMHRSMVAGRKGETACCSNERLEFLGDAIISAVVADILYGRYTNKQEGFLTTLRAKLVKRETLNDLAVRIGLDKLVNHSDKSNLSHNCYMNGNAFEAFIGAVYLDRGYDYCVKFMRERIFNEHIDIEQASRKEENYKSKLIEWAQHYQLKCEFILTSQTMAAGNSPKFVSEVRIEGVVCGKGTGYSKKESHQIAAESAYKKVRNNVRFVNELIEKKNARVAQGGKASEANASSKPAKQAEAKQNKPAQPANATTTALSTQKPKQPATAPEQTPQQATEQTAEAMETTAEGEAKKRRRRRRRPRKAEGDATAPESPSSTAE